MTPEKFYQGGLGIPSLEVMTDIITLKNICNKACHPLLLLQETVNESVKKANISTKTQSLNYFENYFENFCRIARKYDLIPDNCIATTNSIIIL